MNLSSCTLHPDRKQQMLCMSDDCPNRFQLRCVQCIMGSKCRQAHHWKIITEAIEQIFQVCQSVQIKEQKKQGKEKKQISQATIDHQKAIEDAVKDFKGKIVDLQKQINERVDIRAKRILSKTNAGVESYVLVKNILKTCKKDSQPQQLNQKLKQISHYIKCMPDGMLVLVEPVEAESLDDTELSIFQSELNQLLDNLSYIVDEGNEMPSQMEGLKKNYQMQIDKLLEQIKQLPVLQNRIQSLNQKLQAKDARLKKYQQGISPPPNAQEKSQDQLNKKLSTDDSDLVKRIQVLIDRRQKLRTSLIQYCQKSPQQQLFLYNLPPKENIYQLQVPVASQTSYALNQCLLSLADQLQFLKYSDATTGDSFIEVPLISLKKQKQKLYQQQPIGRKKHGHGGNFWDQIIGL